MSNPAKRRTPVAASFSLTRRITSRMPGKLATSTVNGKTAFRWSTDNGANWHGWLQIQRRAPSRSSAGAARSTQLFDPMNCLRWLGRTLFQ